MNEEVEDGNRGNTGGAVVTERLNFALFFGCKPDSGVKANTKMIRDVVKVMIHRINKVHFFVQLVECFEDLKGSDVNFEIVAS